MRAWVFALHGQSDPTKPSRIDVAGFAALGVSAKPRKQDEDVFELWDINAPAWGLFLDVQSQWRVAVLGGALGGAVLRLGLDYAGVDALMRRRGIPDRLFDDLLVMEDAALAAFAEARH